MPPKKGKETVLGWKEIIVVLKNDNVTFLILKIPNFNHCSDVCIYIYIYIYIYIFISAWTRTKSSAGVQNFLRYWTIATSCDRL